MPASTDPPAPRKQCNVRLPLDLLERIDARRARLDLSRDAWMEAAAEYALRAAEGADPGALTNSIARTATPPHRR